MGFMLKDGHKLVCYAPGDGALSFTWEWQGKAEGREVKETEIREFLTLERNAHLRAHDLKFVNHQWRLVAPIMRTGPDSLIFMPTRLICKYTGAGGFNTVFTAEDDGHIVRNENMVSAMKFFINHETELKGN